MFAFSRGTIHPAQESAQVTSDHQQEHSGVFKHQARLHKQAELCGMGYDDQMNEKDDDITHLGIVSETEKTRDFP